jgi:hypothetical protein
MRGVRQTPAIEGQWLTVALEEYKALRAETLAAIDRQQRVAGSGFAIAGVLLGIGAGAKPGSLLQAVLLAGLMPVMTAFVVVVWLGEVERQVRAGSYLAELEARVGARFDEPPLRWESELRRTRPAGPHILNVYRSLVAILLVIGLGGAIIAVVGLHSHGTALQVAVALADAGVLFVAVRLYFASETRMRAQIAGRMRRASWGEMAKRTSTISRMPADHGSGPGSRAGPASGQGTTGQSLVARRSRPNRRRVQCMCPSRVATLGTSSSIFFSRPASSRSASPTASMSAPLGAGPPGRTGSRVSRQPSTSRPMNSSCHPRQPRLRTS